jgi:hypothetical protein
MERPPRGVNSGGRWCWMKRRGKTTPRVGRKSTPAISEVVQEIRALPWKAGPNSEEDIKALAAESRNMALALANQRPVMEGGPVAPPRIFSDVTAKARAETLKTPTTVTPEPSKVKEKKRGPGRPSKNYILEAVALAAYAAAQKNGEYRWIARSWLGISPDRLSDWVRNHRPYFDQKVEEYKKNKLPF